MLDGGKSGPEKAGATKRVKPAPQPRKRSPGQRTASKSGNKPQQLTPGLVEGDHPSLGRLFAAIDPAVRFTEAAVSSSRFEARLHPFKTIEDAAAAILKTGCELASGGHR